MGEALDAAVLATGNKSELIIGAERKRRLVAPESRSAKRVAGWRDGPAER
jgi:hypothetical protein